MIEWSEFVFPWSNYRRVVYRKCLRSNAMNGHLSTWSEQEHCRTLWIKPHFFKCSIYLPDILLVNQLLSRHLVQRRFECHLSVAELPVRTTVLSHASTCQQRSDDRVKSAFAERAFRHSAPFRTRCLEQSSTTFGNWSFKLHNFKQRKKTELYRRAFLRWSVTVTHLRFIDTIREWLNERQQQYNNNIIK